MKENYTATIHVNSYEEQYKQKSGDNLDKLLMWINEEAKESAFDIEIEVVDNHQNKIIEKRICKLP